MHVPPRSRGSAEVRAHRSFVARRLVLPAQGFFHTEGTGGVLLLACALASLAVANSRWGPGFERFLGAHLLVEIGPWPLRGDLREFINDGLMTVFFYVAGLEIKRELIEGELAGFRRAALPVVAALGGMVAPALIYAACNLGGSGARGWGIPTATDIAFSVGILTILGDRVPPSARTFLLALAIADDVGAIGVIALFYSGGINPVAVGAALAFLLVIVLMNRGGVRSPAAFQLASLAFWAAMLGTGIHATLAGVILGAITPLRPWFGPATFVGSARKLLRRYDRALAQGDPDRAEAIMGQFEELSRGTESRLDRRLRQVHPWSSFAVLPLFALANSGVVLTGGSIGRAASGGIAWGIVLGLAVGKPLGIVGFARLAVALGLAESPRGLTWPQVAGLGMVAGVGFTVSLFVAGLAFDDPGRVAEAKLGVLAGSILSGLAGFAFLRYSQPRPTHPEGPPP